MNVAVISLNPVGGQGGSERFTLDAIQSIRSQGDRCEAFAVRDADDQGRSSGMRPFLHTFDAHGERELAFREVLTVLPGFDAVWVHQYLASELIFDVLNAVPERLPLLLTNLGEEHVLPEFTSRYQPRPNHRFMDPADCLAAPARSVGARSTVIRAGIWSDFIGSTNPVAREPRQICTLDGVRANAGSDTAILGLPSQCSLVVVGAPERDAAYLRVVGAAVSGRSVSFTGPVPETRRRNVLAASEVLVAAHVPSALGTDPLASMVVLEAIGCDTLPVASDLPSHVETMASLGLSDLVFPAGQPDALRTLLERVLAMPAEEVARRKSRARSCMRQSWLWDDYWLRVRRDLRLESPEPEKQDRLQRVLLPGVRKAAAGYSLGAHSLNWKAFHF